MTHRQSIAMLVTASLTLAGTAPLQASDSDGIEVRQSEDALYCKERRLGTWFYCEKPTEEPRKSAAAPPPARERLAAIGSELEELKARAILEPSPENANRCGSCSGGSRCSARRSESSEQRYGGGQAGHTRQRGLLAAGAC